jgi:2-hydroxycyclohexanecarboxyl-CoA dehydrogenase
MSSNKNYKPLSECIVMVSGGTSGVGLATAICFAKEGCRKVAIMGRTPERGQQAIARFREQAPEGAQVELILADANDPGQATEAAQQVVARLGGLDALVNCQHSSQPARPFQKIAMAEIEDLLKYSQLAHIYMTRAVLPHMIEQGSGSILNVASDSAKLPTPGGTILGASMAAKVMFSRTLAMEVKRHNVRVNALTPALISGTPAFDEATSDAFMAKVFAEAERKTALGFPSAEDVAELIVFLSGPKAAKITGQAISINGGMSAA